MIKVKNDKTMTDYDKVKNKLLDFFKTVFREDEDHAIGIMALSTSIGMFSNYDDLYRKLLDILVLPKSGKVLYDFMNSEFAEYKIIMLQEKLACK